jgi:hypothetical protein
MIRRVAAVGAAVGLLAACPVAGAAVQDPVPIGPNEGFVGLVNSASANGVIQMGCFGPITPGEMGHPLAGQSTQVQLASLAMFAGFTGDAHQIRATLAYDSPAALPVVLATFDNYYVRAPISTSLELPCAGKATVAFTPVNGGPSSRPWDETVTFASQA